MNGATIAYLVGMFAILVRERLLTGSGAPATVALAVGVVALLASVGLHGWTLVQARGEAGTDGLRRLRLRQLVFAVSGAASLLIYAVSTEALTPTGSDEFLRRWQGTFGALWPVAWILGTVPLLALDRVSRSAGPHVPVRRVQEVTGSAVVAALAIAVIFPVNYVASTHNKVWDLAYFRTTEVGTATRAVADTLSEPVTVRVFQAPASDVTPELRKYFDALKGPNVQVEYLDQAADPVLAKILRVSENGWVTLTVGEIDRDGPVDDPSTFQDESKTDDGKPQPISKRIEIGKELKRARRKLKTLDREVQKRLRELSAGKQVVYFTSGHGEFTWKGGGEPDRKLRRFRELLKFLGFEIKEFTTPGQLARGVPEDADLIAIIGPDGPFFDAEIEVLKAWLADGGRLLVALEPQVLNLRAKMAAGQRDPLVELLGGYGVDQGDGLLASEAGVHVMFRNKADRTNLLTNRYATHPITKALNLEKPPVPILVPSVGYFEEDKEQRAAAKTNVTMLARSLEVSWVDKDADLDFDEGTETKGSKAVAAAISGGSETAEFRVVAVADAQLFSDAVIRGYGNAQFAADAANWLMGLDSLAGTTTNNEEDVKIEHSREGQGWWFYGTTLAVPILVLLAGLVRTELRRRGGAA